MGLDELKEYPNWVCWKPMTVKKGNGELVTKKPIISPISGNRGSHSNPEDWTTYQKAKAFYIANKRKLGLGGVGFVFSEDAPYVGIDIDECIDESGELNEYAQRILTEFSSYAELSPNNGIHIIGKCDFNFPGSTSKTIEIYSTNRYFTVTGKTIPGYETINDVTRQLRYRLADETSDDEEQPAITIDEVSDMLSVIPADGLDYNSEWLRILMAVHSEFPGADGLAAVKTWTERYSHVGELEQKWSSFRKGGVGIGTLVYFAKEHGYTPRTRVASKLDTVTPPLTLVQREQTEKIIEQLAEEKAWKLFHKFLKEHRIDIGYPEQVIDHLQLGVRQRRIDKNTGEIVPEAITVPYKQYGEIVAIEYRSEEGYTYDGRVGLYTVEPMFDDSMTSFGVVLPDSIQAIDYYLSGDGSGSSHGLPHTPVELELPDKDLYCLFDDSTSLDQLELLNSYGVKFVKVQSVPRILQNLDKTAIESIAVRGKPLNKII